MPGGISYLVGFSMTLKDNIEDVLFAVKKGLEMTTKAGKGYYGVYSLVCVIQRQYVYTHGAIPVLQSMHGSTMVCNQVGNSNGRQTNNASGPYFRDIGIVSNASVTAGGSHLGTKESSSVHHQHNLVV